MDVPRRPIRVLIADDDPGTRDLLTLGLQLEGFAVDLAIDGIEVVVRFDPELHDAVVTDLMMPKGSGLSVVRAIRRQSDVPVLIVTAHDDAATRVLALEGGADDVLGKPFDPRELALRIQNLVVGHVVPESTPLEDVVACGPLEIWPHAREATLGGQRLDLAGKELDLLLTMAKSPRKVFTRAELLQQVWDSNPDWQSVDTVTEHVYRVRQKLAAHPDGERLIQTVRGAGYRLTA